MPAYNSRARRAASLIFLIEFANTGRMCDHALPSWIHSTGAADPGRLWRGPCAALPRLWRIRNGAERSTAGVRVRFCQVAVRKRHERWLVARLSEGGRTHQSDHE